ncbi:MAG: ArdC-like ssDNA-binding domain-containing protein [Isosphaeraceae bacterium]
MTYKQAAKLGGNVRRGEKATPVLRPSKHWMSQCNRSSCTIAASSANTFN